MLLPPATKLRQGNVFTSMCQEFCPQLEGACVPGGGVHGRGVYGRGHAWQGTSCMAGGVHGRVHAWQEGVHGGGGCVHGRGHSWQGGREKWQLQRAVRILLKCILVLDLNVQIWNNVGNFSKTVYVKDYDGSSYRILNRL